MENTNIQRRKLVFLGLIVTVCSYLVYANEGIQYTRLENAECIQSKKTEAKTWTLE